MYKRLVVLLILPVLAACDDGLGPRFWVATPDTLSLHSLSRDEYVGRASAIDIVAEPITPLPVEASGVTGNWDFALIDASGGLALMPSSALAALGSRARVAMLTGRTLADVTEAPRDTALYSAAAVTLRPDAVYVIRSRRASCGFSSGYRYAKLQAVDIDQARGTLRFAIVRNPYCDDRSFVPPEN